MERIHMDDRDQRLAVANAAVSVGFDKTVGGITRAMCDV